MASPPTSRLAFLDGSGAPWPSPREWMPELIEVELEPALLTRARLFRQTESLPLYVRELAGQLRVLAEWTGACTGWYRLRLELDDELSEELMCEVSPTKISPDSYRALIDDLHSDRLPASIAGAPRPLGGAARP